MPTYPPLGPPSSNVFNAKSAFINIRPGQFIIVRTLPSSKKPGAIDDDWWLGQVIMFDHGTSKPRFETPLQVADVDDGSIHWVRADQVAHVLHGLDGIGQEGWDGFEDD